MWSVLATIILCSFIIGTFVLLGAQHVRRYTDPVSGKVSNTTWLEPALLLLALMTVGFLQRTKRKH